MLYRAKLAHRVINFNDDSFPLDGMVKPTFINDGDTTVLINKQKVLPGEHFPIELDNAIFEGSVSIEFVKSENPDDQDRLFINYGVYIGPGLDLNGNLLNQKC